MQRTVPWLVVLLVAMVVALSPAPSTAQTARVTVTAPAPFAKVVSVVGVGGSGSGIHNRSGRRPIPAAAGCTSIGRLRGIHRAGRGLASV